MKIKVESKFGVGDLVSIKHTDASFQIVEVLSHTCYAGTQIYYFGRVHARTDYFTARKFTPVKDFSKFCEVELEKITDKI